ncbi:MAG: hypothetical protein R2711_06040 [Acidimicrobiales bacterium]
MVELREEGYGFLRLNGYLPSRDDAYVSLRQARQFGLRTGDIVRGKSRPAGRNEKNPALLQVDAVNGHQAHNQPAPPLRGAHGRAPPCVSGSSWPTTRPTPRPG